MLRAETLTHYPTPTPPHNLITEIKTPVEGKRRAWLSLVSLGFQDAWRSCGGKCYKRDRGRGGTTNTQITLYTRGMEVIRSVPAGPAVLLPWAEKRPGHSRPLAGGNTQPTRHCNLAGLRAERSSPRLPEALPDLLTKKICNRHRPQIHQITV